MKLGLAIALVACLGAANAAHHANLEGEWTVSMTLMSAGPLCSQAGITGIIEALEGSGSDGEEQPPGPIMVDDLEITDVDGGVDTVMHFSGLGLGYEALKSVLGYELCPDDDDGEGADCPPMPDLTNEVVLGAYETFGIIGAIYGSACPAPDNSGPGLTAWSISEFADDHGHDDDAADDDAADDDADDSDDGSDGETIGAASVAASAVVAMAAAFVVSKAQL